MTVLWLKLILISIYFTHKLITLTLTGVMKIYPAIIAIIKPLKFTKKRSIVKIYLDFN